VEVFFLCQSSVLFRLCRNVAHVVGGVNSRGHGHSPHKMGRFPLFFPIGEGGFAARYARMIPGFLSALRSALCFCVSGFPNGSSPIKLGKPSFEGENLGSPSLTPARALPLSLGLHPLSRLEGFREFCAFYNLWFEEAFPQRNAFFFFFCLGLSGPPSLRR